MNDLGLDLTVIWAIIIAVVIAAYVMMDGFDLGIGILFPGLGVGRQRDTAINAIAPFWDGNETWLVLGGGGLMAAFPLAFAIIFPALYIPLIVMLLGLVFRGVAFEFRFRDPGHRSAWDIGFVSGSVVAALMQGIALGAILQGIEVSGRAYGGGWWYWLSPFTVLTGVSLVAGYALLGACWLIWKTEGDLQQVARRRARPLALALVTAIIAVSIATPFLETKYFDVWFQWPNILYVSPVPVLVAVFGFLLWRSIGTQRDFVPFLLTLGLFVLTLVGLGLSMWPDVIPGRVSIWDAAAPPESQGFMLIGVLILLPVILAYTVWSYWVFRGKVGDEGYH